MSQTTPKQPGSQTPDRITESKLGATAEDVFLSPRVIDDAAFDRMTEVLRHLIAEAARSGESIRRAVGSATRVLELYREANADEAGASVAALESAVREAKSLEVSFARVRDEASLRTQRLERVSLAATDAIEKQRQSLDAIVASVRAETLRATAELRGAMDAARQSAAKLPDDTSDVIREQLDTMIEEAVGRADERLKKQLRASYQQGKKAFEMLDAELVGASKRAAEIEARLEKARALEASFDEAKLERIEKVLRALGSSKTSKLVDRLLEASPRAEQAADRLDALQSQVGVAQKTLADAILEGATEIDRLIDRAPKPSSAA